MEERIEGKRRALGEIVTPRLPCHAPGSGVNLRLHVAALGRVESYGYRWRLPVESGGEALENG